MQLSNYGTKSVFQYRNGKRKRGDETRHFSYSHNLLLYCQKRIKKYKKEDLRLKNQAVSFQLAM